MNTAALKTAAKTGYPADKLLGVWWAGSEEDVIPAGDAAKGYVSAAFSAPGTNFPVMQDIKTKVYGAGKGNLEDPTRQGSIYHTRGVVYGMIIVEAIRVAQDKYGKGKVMTPEQVRWGLEHLNLTEARIKELGAAGLFPPIKTSCARSRRLGHGQVPAMGRQGLQAGHAVHGGRPRAGAQDGRGERRQVRGGEEDHAARLRQGRLIRQRARPSPSPGRGLARAAAPLTLSANRPHRPAR